MAPLKEDCRSDKEELIGKALLMDSFISDSTDTNELRNSESSEVRSVTFRDDRKSIVVTLKNSTKLERLEYFDEVPERRNNIKHDLKAKVALFVVMFLIGFMAVFAFLTIKKNAEAPASNSHSLTSSNLGLSVANKTGVTDWAVLNGTKVEGYVPPST